MGVKGKIKKNKVLSWFTRGTIIWQLLKLWAHWQVYVWNVNMSKEHIAVKKALECLHAYINLEVHGHFHYRRKWFLERE